MQLRVGTRLLPAIRGAVEKNVARAPRPRIPMGNERGRPFYNSVARTVVFAIGYSLLSSNQPGNAARQEPRPPPSQIILTCPSSVPISFQKMHKSKQAVFKTLFPKSYQGTRLAGEARIANPELFSKLQSEAL
jgi:hypothetical protein